MVNSLTISNPDKLYQQSKLRPLCTFYAVDISQNKEPVLGYAINLVRFAIRISFLLNFSLKI